MALKAYTGSGGSGKSLFAVANEIFPALVAGRRVLTNIEGMGDPERQAKLFRLVKEAGGPEAPDFHAVGHSALTKAGAVIWPVDQGRELADNTRVFDDTNALAKFGTLVVWDEGSRFTPTKLDPIWHQAVTYHRHWGLPDSPFDIVVLHQSFSDFNVLVRDMTQVAYLFAVTSKLDVSVRATFRRPGEKSKLKLDDSDAIRETLPHPKKFYGTYKSQIADGEHKDTKLPSFWKSRYFRSKMVLIGCLLGATIAGASYLKEGSLFQQYGPGGQLAKVANVAPGSSSNSAGSVGPAALTDETSPGIVASYNAADGEWLALVKDGGRFVEVKASAGGVRYKGRVIQWPTGH